MKTKKLILNIVLLFFIGCTNDLNSLSNSTSRSEDFNSSETPNLINENISFSARFDDPSNLLDNGQIINYNNTTQSLEITIRFPLGASLPGISGTIRQNSNITFETDPIEGTITLTIPILDYIELVESPTTLPNGRPLPDINGGEPPSFSFPLKFLGLNAYGYAAFDSFSIFVEIGLKLPLNLTVPIRSEQNNSHIGNIHWLAPINEHSGGVFISLRLPQKLSVLLANVQ